MLLQWQNSSLALVVLLPVVWEVRSWSCITAEAQMQGDTAVQQLGRLLLSQRWRCLDEMLNIEPFSSSLSTGQAEVKNLMMLLPQDNPNTLANISSRSRSGLWCSRQSCTILGVCWLPKLPLQPLHYRCSVLGFFGLEYSRGCLSIRRGRKSQIPWCFILQRTKLTLPLTDFCNIFRYLFSLERTVLRVCLRLPSIFQATLPAVDISS